jgi:hypothetical protein
LPPAALASVPFSMVMLSSAVPKMTLSAEALIAVDAAIVADSLVKHQLEQPHL